MTIEFKCSQCQTMLRVADEAAARQVRCPSCQAITMAPGVSGADSAPQHTTPQYGSSALTPAEENPYRSPMPSPVPTAGVPELVGGPLEAGYVLSRAWEIFKIHWGLCLVATLIPAAAQQMGGVVLQVAVGILSQIDPAVGIIGFILLYLAMLVAIIWINIGQMLFMLRVAQGETPDIMNLFRGGPWLLSMILLAIIIFPAMYLFMALVIGVPTGLGAVLGLALGSKEPVFAIIGLVVGSVCALGMIVYLGLGISQCAYFLIDRNAGIFESLRGSWQMTQGNRLAIFLVFVLITLINMGGLLACCIGILATMPYTALAVAVMYTILARSPRTLIA